MESKILIIGANGMLGHDLVEGFSDYELTTWDQEDLDITDEQSVLEKITRLKPDVIINSAAYTDVDKAESDKDAAMAVNADGVGNLAKAANSISAILVHFSTESVFDGTSPNGYAEDSEVNPVNVYGKSKAEGERLLQEFHDKFYIIRSSWLYGKAPQVGKGRGLNFVDTMLKLSQEKDELQVVDDQFGKPTFTKDLVKLTKKLIEDKMPFGIYHGVNEGVCTWYDLAEKTFDIKGVDILLKPISSKDYPVKTPRPKNPILHNNKVDKLRNWEEALEEYLNL